ncbi:MAG: hypothetical protein QOK36_3175 [Gaiellales bacterium]|jgi:hypothetical protein|nr:hypothetical protein [Gaiellales bacterium]
MRRALLTAVVALAVGAVAPAVAGARLVHFQSPSGRINCIAGTGSPVFVDCLVRRAAWKQPPPKPLGCDLDWNPYELQLTSHHVAIGACRGDVGPTCRHDCTTLPYGRSVALGPIRCRSAVNGVTCRYVRAKLAGFRIAREGYVVWRR